MELDAERCYQAVLSRDRRFDGRIFGGVITTGVYCRPICPVRTPKPENIRWFACAAAAEAAGFRPCRRCRPETAPGTPAWMGSSAVVSRALRLIADGALDEDGVDELASRLGMGARQLRRLFAAHLGASPAAIAGTRRVHFAAKLIEETDLPIARVAYSAGFTSIRQFNHAVLTTFKRPPTALRRNRNAREHDPSTSNGQGLLVRLPYRPPLNWGAIIAFLKPRAIPGVEVVEQDSYRRTIEVGGVPGTIELSAAAGEALLLMRVHLPGYDGLIQVVERARRIFDLGADPLQITAHLRRSQTLRQALKATPGLRVPGAWDGFELAVRAVLGQQVTVKGATTLAGRLVTAFGEPLKNVAADGLTHLFPSPRRLAAADPSVIGIPAARSLTIRALAGAVCAGELSLDAGQGLDEAVARLRTMPGIGAWTAHYIAMRALGEPDAFPAGDLGLRRALGNGTPISAAEVAHVAEPWRPWRAYAAMYLWTNGAGSKEGTHAD